MKKFLSFLLFIAEFIATVRLYSLLRMKKKALNPPPYITKSSPLFLPSVIDFSVILPIHNKAESLKHILDPLWNSLMKQTYKGKQLSWEVIIVNNGSTDELSMSLKNLLLKRNPLYSQRMTYVDCSHRWDSVSAVKFGACYARGSYIMMCDCDPTIYILKSLPLFISPLLPVAGYFGADVVTISTTGSSPIRPRLKKYLKLLLGSEMEHCPYPIVFMTRRTAQLISPGKIGGKGLRGMLLDMWLVKREGLKIKHIELEGENRLAPTNISNKGLIKASIGATIVILLHLSGMHPLPQTPVLPSKIKGYGK